MSTEPYRLPRTVWPERYDIDLDARPSRPSFTGQVTIRVRVEAATDRVELHARDLAVAEAHAEVGGRSFEGTVELDPPRERLILHLPERIPEGEATLTLRFTGKVSRNMEGLYLSKNGPEECLATQCEETDARAIFPCFDEPEFKARFAWHVTTDADLTVLANGPATSVEDTGDGDRRWSFEATRPIASYLVALAVGAFRSTEELRAGDVPLKVWALSGKERLGGFANDLSARLMPWFEEYFGAPYPYGKYDQVAVPSFSAGAMENVGLVIFRESLLLLDPENAPWRQEKTVAQVVAHEQAHMWFGNLVTMRWWSDLWLNEAFAEWMAHKAVDAMHPEYRIWDDFQGGKAVALASDALESTHPIYSPVETPEQATELFDAITYQKGSAVMRMLENYLGEDAFRAGLRTYMQEFKEANAEGADLWRHLGKASRQPVERIMTSWISQGGYPSVRFTLADDGRALQVRQSRYFSRADAEASDALWQVPLVIRWADDRGEHVTRHLLGEREATIPLDAEGEVRWLHGNADGIGFYRVNAGDRLLDGLLANLPALSASEQVGVLDDQWALVENGAQAVERFLDTLDAVAEAAENHTVLARVAGHMHGLEARLEDIGDEAALEAFRAWVQERLTPKLDALGVEPRKDENRDASQRRVILMETLGAVALEPRARDAALQLAAAEAERPEAVPGDLAGPAVRVAARHGGTERFERYVSIYTARRDAGAGPAETQRYLGSFPEFREPALVERTLRLIDDGVLPLEAVGPILRSMLGTRHTRVAAWEWMKDNWKVVRENLGDMWTGFLVEHTGYLPPDRREDLVRFLDANLHGVAQQAYARAIERLDHRAELHARIRDGLVAWFRQRAA